MEHTNEFLRGMFAAYMGSPVLETHNDGDTITDVIDWEFLSRYKYNDVDGKPILTPLSEISNGDAVEVAKVDDKNREYKFGNNRGFKPDEYKAIWNGKTFFVERYYRGRYVGGYPIALIPSLLNIEQIDYLRSKHYDCGYLHISSLISAGLAVKAPR